MEEDEDPDPYPSSGGGAEGGTTALDTTKKKITHYKSHFRKLDTKNRYSKKNIYLAPHPRSSLQQLLHTEAGGTGGAEGPPSLRSLGRAGEGSGGAEVEGSVGAEVAGRPSEEDAWAWRSKVSSELTTTLLPPC